MAKQSLLEKSRRLYENNLLLVTIIALLIGFILRFFADPTPLNDLPKLGREIAKEIGGFILATFLIAFLYEAFIDYRNREEFRRELNEILRDKFRGGLHAIHERRPTLGYKAGKLREVQETVIEVGTALNSFKEYIDRNQTTDMSPGSSGYRDIMEERMRRGVKVTCLMLDPEVAATPVFQETSPGLEAKIRNSLAALKKIRDDFERHYPGRFEIRLYRAIPTFACIGFDAERGDQGQLLVSPYLLHRDNASLPVLEIHQVESPALFAVYRRAIQDLKAASVVVS